MPPNSVSYSTAKGQDYSGSGSAGQLGCWRSYDPLGHRISVTAAENFPLVVRQNLMPFTDSRRHGEHDARPGGLPVMNRKFDWET